MEAKELLNAVMNGSIEIEQSGYAHGYAIITAGPYRYFGSESSGIGIKEEFDYFYYYDESNHDFAFMPTPSVVLPDTETGDGYSIYLWEIEK